MNLLTQDLTKVDTSRLLLAKGQPMRFKVDMKLGNAKNGKSMLITTYSSAFKGKSEPTKDGTVVDLNPGFKIISNTMVETTGDLTEEQIMKSLARIQEEILGTKTSQFMPLEQYIGKEVDAIVEIEEDASGKYGPQNRLKKITPAKR